MFLHPNWFQLIAVFSITYRLFTWICFALFFLWLCFEIVIKSWWRHQIKIFSSLVALCAGNLKVIGEFPAQTPVTRSFGVFFDVRLNKRLSKQS